MMAERTGNIGRAASLTAAALRRRIPLAARPTCGTGRYRLDRYGAALRERLLALGARHMTDADFSQRGGVVRQYWETTGGQTFSLVVHPDGSVSW